MALPPPPFKKRIYKKENRYLSRPLASQVWQRNTTAAPARTRLAPAKCKWSTRHTRSAGKIKNKKQKKNHPICRDGTVGPAVYLDEYRERGQDLSRLGSGGIPACPLRTGLESSSLCLSTLPLSPLPPPASLPHPRWLVDSEAISHQSLQIFSVCG